MSREGDRSKSDGERSSISDTFSKKSRATDDAESMEARHASRPTEDDEEEDQSWKKSEGESWTTSRAFTVSAKRSSAEESRQNTFKTWTDGQSSESERSLIRSKLNEVKSSDDGKTPKRRIGVKTEDSRKRRSTSLKQSENDRDREKIKAQQSQSSNETGTASLNELKQLCMSELRKHGSKRFLTNSSFESEALPACAMGCDLSVSDLQMNAGIQVIRDREAAAGRRINWESDFRLSPHVIPFHYDVYLHPNILTKLFYGRVEIHFELTRPKSWLWLHLKGLNVTSTQLFNGQGSPVELLSTCKYPRHEFWIVFCDKSLPTGKYRLKMDYNGRLRTSSVGFVHDERYDDKGNCRSSVFTLLEPIYARRVFPCFDEPNFKATFKVHLVRPSDNYIALSNMPEESREPDVPAPGLTRVTFVETPLMCTYLLSFVVCPSTMSVEIIEMSSGIRVVGYVGKNVAKELAGKLANMVKEALEYFEEYFQRVYPLPKLDIITIKDLPPRAMENWGIIMINEALVEETRDLFDYESLTFTIALQVANMWIGNLVSIRWWNDIWLKEGLTIHQANTMCKALSPKTQDMSNFLLAHLHRALYEDALRSSRQILQNVDHPREIACAYSSLTYAKVATLLGMFEQMDPGAFRSGLINFIDKYAFQSAPAASFLHEISGNRKFMDVGRTFEMWINQPGYPVILAARQENILAMAQIRCSADIKNNLNVAKPENDSKWDFPISLVTSLNPFKPEIVILDGGVREVRVSIDDIRWFKVNFQQRGYFRVTYQQQEWANLRNVLYDDPNQMTPEDRANLIDDSLSLARSGYLCYGVALNFISYFKSGKESHWLPWCVLSRHVSFLKNALDSYKEDAERLKIYIRSIIKSSVKDELWLPGNQNEISERKFRVAVLDLVCKMENYWSLSEARKQFKEWQRDNKKPHSDVRRLVFKYGMDHDGNLTSNWNFLWNLYLTEEDANERTMLLEILSTVNDSQILNNLLNKLKKENSMSDHDSFLVLYEMSSFRKGNKVVWNFIKHNWEFMTKRFSGCMTCLWLLFPHMALLQQTDKELEEVRVHLRKSAIPSSENASDNILCNISWNQKYRKIVSEWLQLIVAQMSSKKK